MQFINDGNRIFIPNLEGNGCIGEVAYTLLGNDKFSIDHIYVNPDFRGKKIAEQLFDAAIQMIQQTGRKAVPICSYAVKQFEKRKDLRSLLAK